MSDTLVYILFSTGAERTVVIRQEPMDSLLPPYTQPMYAHPLSSTVVILSDFVPLNKGCIYIL